MRRVSPAACILLVVLPGAIASGCAARATPAATAATAPSTTARDTHETLQGVLWMQTAAEYWALTASAYRDAQARLDIALNDKTATAALEQKGSYQQLPPAVILDLDETVLDNSPFQGQLVLDRAAYLEAAWEAWVERRSADVLPGARAFIAYAESKGVAVFFVTNRAARQQTATLANLAALEIKATDATVLCPGENNWTSDKTARRAEIARTHRILLLVGDDMNDFVSTATLTPQQRVDLAMTHRDRWGRSWVLVPNPVYGTWDRALYPSGSTDQDILAAKRGAVRGFR